MAKKSSNIVGTRIACLLQLCIDKQWHKLRFEPAKKVTDMKNTFFIWMDEKNFIILQLKTDGTCH